jgi:hypothetical protein
MGQEFSVCSVLLAPSLSNPNNSFKIKQNTTEIVPFPPLFLADQTHPNSNSNQQDFSRSNYGDSNTMVV